MRTWVGSGPDERIVEAASGELQEILQRPHAYGGQYDAIQANL